MPESVPVAMFAVGGESDAEAGAAISAMAIKERVQGIRLNTVSMSRSLYWAARGLACRDDIFPDLRIISEPSGVLFMESIAWWSVIVRIPEHARG